MKTLVFFNVFCLIYAVQFEKFKESVNKLYPNSNYKISHLYFSDNGDLKEIEISDKNSTVIADWTFGGQNYLVLNMGGVIDGEERRCQGITKLRNTTKSKPYRSFNWNISTSCYSDLMIQRFDRHIFVALVNPTVRNTAMITKLYVFSEVEIVYFSGVNKMVKNGRHFDIQSQHHANLTYHLDIEFSTDPQKVKYELVSSIPRNTTVYIPMDNSGKFEYFERTMVDGRCIIYEGPFDEYGDNLSLNIFIDKKIYVAVLQDKPVYAGNPDAASDELYAPMFSLPHF